MPNRKTCIKICIHIWKSNTSFKINSNIKCSSISHLMLSNQITRKWIIRFPISSITTSSISSWSSISSYHYVKWKFLKRNGSGYRSTPIILWGHFCNIFPHHLLYKMIFDKMNYFRLHNNLSQMKIKDIQNFCDFLEREMKRQ